MARLDDHTQLEAVDPGKMLDYVLRLPDMAQPAFERGSQVRLPLSAPRQILVCGMGGSAISGDLARTLLAGTSKVPLLVNRANDLPAWVGADTLVVLMSYSGNTAETLGCLNAAVARKVPAVLVTSGGKFAAIAGEHHLPVVAVEGGWSPRAALGELFFALLGVLSRVDACHVPVEAVGKAIAQLRADRAAFGPEVQLAGNPAKQLAERLSTGTPVVFGVTGSTEAVALRWKCQINENSKRTVLFNLFPELTHNEIVNLAHHPALDPVPPSYQAVVLRDPADPALLAQQLDIAMDILRPRLAGVVELSGTGEDLLTRQLSLSYLGDWVSVYMALLADVDPTPVSAIGTLKDRMAAKPVNA